MKPQELEVLTAVYYMKGKGYTNTIHNFVQNASDKKLTFNQLYRVPNKLESAGFVSFVFGDPTPERGGRRKKLYTCTETGAAELQQQGRVTL